MSHALKDDSHDLKDVDGDILRVDTNRELILGAHRGAIAEFNVTGPWCPNASQLRSLRGLLDAIMAAHERVDAGPYRIVHCLDLGGETIEIESGSIPGVQEHAIVRIDINGNESGPVWIGAREHLVKLRDACNQALGETQLLSEAKAQAALESLFDMINAVRPAVELLGELGASNVGDVFNKQGLLFRVNPVRANAIATAVNFAAKLVQRYNMEGHGDGI